VIAAAIDTPAALSHTRAVPELPRRIALTGLDTFVGQRMVERLLASEPTPDVLGLDLRLPRRLEGRVRFAKVDLTDPTADSMLAELLEKERCECVLHAAFFQRPSADVAYEHELEVIGTLHVMNAAAAAGVRKLVVPSTARVYGARPDNPNYLSEAHELRPHPASHRVRDRAEMEELLERFATRHAEMVVTRLRPCWVMGPSFESQAIRHFSGARVITVLGYDPLMQFLHEEDWLDALERALRVDAPGVFNVAGAGVLPLSTLLALAGKRRIAVPHPLLYRLDYLPGLWSTGEPPEAFYDYLRFLWTVDTGRAREQLGFRPTYSTKEAWMSFVVSRRLRSYR
jgi:UDP-glucose 4-epimerase